MSEGVQGLVGDTWKAYEGYLRYTSAVHTGTGVSQGYTVNPSAHCGGGMLSCDLRSQVRLGAWRLTLLV